MIQRALLTALAILLVSPAEARRHYRHGHLCPGGQILIVHEGRCVGASTRAALEVRPERHQRYRRLVSRSSGPVVPDDDERVTVVTKSKGDSRERARAAKAAPEPSAGSEIEFDTPQSRVGLPGGRWWMVR